MVNEVFKSKEGTEELAELILRKDKEWSLLDGELCLVSEFTPLMGSVVKDGVVSSPETTVPYASLNLECTKTPAKITGFITHKIDFANLWSVFKERQINKEKEEALIYWTAKHYKYKILQLISDYCLTILGAAPFPKVIVMVCPKGTYKSCTGGFPLIGGKEIRVFIYGLMSRDHWIPDVIK